MSDEKKDISGLLGIVAGVALMAGVVLVLGGGWMAYTHLAGGGGRRAKARAEVAAAEPQAVEAAAGPKVHTADDAAAMAAPEEGGAGAGEEAGLPGGSGTAGGPAPDAPATDPSLDALLDAQAADVEADAPEDAPAVAAAGRPAKAKGKKRAPGECKVDSPDIAAVGPGRYQITRAFLDRYTADLSGAESLADVWWAKNGAGEIVGFRIRKIPCKSPLREAGFRPGDVIRSVNGREIRSTGAAVKAYRALRRGDTLVVRVRRDKAWREQVYEVVDGALAPAAAPAPAPAAPPAEAPPPAPPG